MTMDLLSFHDATSRAYRLAILLSFLLPALAATVGCDDDKLAALPRLGEKVYVTVRVGPAVPSAGAVEITNLSDRPLELSTALITDKHMEPLMNLAPGQTRDVGWTDLNASQEVIVFAKNWQPAAFTIVRGAGGMIDVQANNQLASALNKSKSHTSLWVWIVVFVFVVLAVAKLHSVFMNRTARRNGGQANLPAASSKEQA
jgi:hypothetical protein